VSAEQAIEQGDFRGALAALEQETAGGAADPSRLLMRFNMEVRLCRFPAAAATMQRLVAAAPELAVPMSAFMAAAQAEELAVARRRDPALAGRRATVGLPNPYALALAKAATLHAQGDAAGAGSAIHESKAATPRIAGTLVRIDGHAMPFVGITDTDELTGATLPLYAGGQLLDLPLADLASLEFHQPKTSFDVMWAPVVVTMVDGQRLSGRVPSFYPGTGLAEDAAVRTGQMTTWDHDRGYAIGSGLRDWSLTLPDGGQSLMGISRVARIDFDNARRAQAAGPGAWGSQGAQMGGSQLGGAHSPLAASVHAIAGATVIALGARAALPALDRVTGMLDLPFIPYVLYEGLEAITALVAVILYFVWFARLYAWVRQARGGTEYSTGMAIGGWFIPFLNLVIPYRALNDAAKRTLGGPAPLVGLWWAAYLVAMPLQLYFGALTPGSQIDMPPALFVLLGWLSSFAQITAYGVWAKIVRDLTDRVR
jgi:protein involved in temperature-dependent protein secretion